MTQEQKAKAYDEAIERAEKALEVFGTDKCEGARQIFSLFPELKESEDEKIRKELIDYINRLTASPNNIEKYNTWIAWLEKQGEKLPVGFYYVNSEGKKFYSDTFKYGDVTLHVEKQGKQKPYWSEEDERILDAFITSLNNEVFAGRLETLKGIGVSLVIKWLKSLKDRCTWKPSEE